MKRLILIAGLLMPAAAQAATPAAAPVPVEISADKSLEWNRSEQTYTARGNVVATQGNATVKSDLLVASYAGAQGETDVTTLTATGHVTVQSPPYTAYGDRAVYNVKTGRAVLTGQGLKAVSTTDTLTARDKIEFISAEDRMVATGDASVTHGTYVVTADTMSAWFTADAQAHRTAKKITASGHVTIKTENETVTGDEAVYDLATQKAVLTGKVLAHQGDSWLEGTRADVDMTTGISQLSGGGNADTGGRVKGVFYPKSKQE